MLTIPKPLNAGQAQTYHAKEFSSPDQNYWQKGDVNLGEWQGQLAESFGLSGPVDAEHFARLSQGQHPVSGEQLVKHRPSKEYSTGDGKTVKPVEHRAGWDATFSAPKSISLAALVGGDVCVRPAHREAVTAALTELEHYTQARIGGNNAAETTGKFIVAKFEHDTARPVDDYPAPQLHTHAVIFNMTERANGKARALQERALFDTQQFATAVYQPSLPSGSGISAIRSRLAAAERPTSRGSPANTWTHRAHAPSRYASTSKRMASRVPRLHRSPRTVRAAARKSSPQTR